MRSQKELDKLAMKRNCGTDELLDEMLPSRSFGITSAREGHH